MALCGGRIAALSVVAAMVALGAGAAPGLAATGSVYFDAKDNAAAGQTSFNGTFTGTGNVGLGRSVMPALTTGGSNVAVGPSALGADTTGSANVGIGYETLGSNTSGDENVASGFRALFFNTTGTDNVAAGIEALSSNFSGSNNVATGPWALNYNEVGQGNVAMGYQALLNATGSRNVAIGSHAGANLTTGARNVYIANPGVADESRTIRIGIPGTERGTQTAAYLAGVWGGKARGRTKAVVVNAKGRLATAPAPAALSRLRDKLHHQGAELRQQKRTFTHQIERLREQVGKGG